MKKKLSVLFVVQAGRNYGTGHLKRCLQIAAFYKEAFFVVYTDMKEPLGIDKLIKEIPYVTVPEGSKEALAVLAEMKPYDVLVVDCAEQSQPVRAALASGIPSIVLDNKDLGLFGDIFIRSLPTSKQNTANYSRPYYTPIPSIFFESSEEEQGVLISLGGSDPQKNALKALSAFQDSGEKITLIKGPLSSYPEIEASENLQVENEVSSLAPYLKKSRFVICGPGLTLLEALAAGKRVIVISHSVKQYQSLKNVGGFETLQGGLFLSPKAIKKASERAKPGTFSIPEGFSFEDWWCGLAEGLAGRPAVCPLCGSYTKKALSRGENHSFFTCGVCKSEYYYPLAYTEPLKEGESLIAENPEQNLKEYKNAILALKEDSRRRIMILKNMTAETAGHRLLDIGSGEGVFIQEAMDNGISAWGVELSTFARSRTKDLYNIEIFDSMDKAYSTGPYSIVTVWNNLHRLENPFSVLQGFARLIPSKGILAFRAPIEGELFSGKFRMTEKGGELLALRLGLKPLKIVSVSDNSGIKYKEVYCVRP